MQRSTVRRCSTAMCAVMLIGATSAGARAQSEPARGGAQQAPVTYQTTFAGAGINLPIETVRQRRFARVVQQQRDFSCGSAALATLLTYHYDLPVNEGTVFEEMWARGDQAKIRERGFSLLDMKTFLASRGLLADGYQLTLERTAEVGVPAIALIDWKGYKHFVVVKGIGPDRVLLGDPSAGLVARSRAAFEESWDGTIFFIRSRAETGRARFNLAADWQAEPTGPVGAGPGFRSASDDTFVRSLPVDSAFSLFRGF